MMNIIMLILKFHVKSNRKQVMINFENYKTGLTILLQGSGEILLRLGLNRYRN